jgi:hypothetical protein
MVFIRETAARPANDGDAQTAQSVDHVVAHAARVGNRGVFAHPDAAVDAVAEVFGELAVNIAVYDRTGLVGVDRQLTGGVIRTEGGGQDERWKQDGES